MARTISRRAVVGGAVVSAGPALTALTALTALAGCATPGGGSGIQVKEQVTLTAMLRHTQQEVDLQKAAFQLFEQQHPNIKVDPISAESGTYDTKTDTMLAAGDPPSLWWPAWGRGYRFYAARSQFEELDPLMARDKYDGSDFFPGLLAFCKWKGKYNCLPSQVTPQILIYNKSLLEKEGVAAPPRDWKDRSWTWARLLANATQLTKRNGTTITQAGLGVPGGSDRFHAQTYGGDWFELAAYESGYPKQLAPQKEAVIDGIQHIADLRHRHRVWPTAAEISELRAGNAIPTLFQTNKSAMEITTSGTFSTNATITEFQWGVAAVPNPPSLPRNNWFYADQWAMFKGQKNKDAGWLLLKHMAGADALRLWPLQRGGMPARKSVSPDWIKFYLGKGGVTEADLKVAIEAVDVSKITPSHAIVEFLEMWEKAIKPEQDKVLANEQPMRAAFDKIAPLAQDIMQRTAPR